jgi:ribose 5-phosphate isomerase B
MKIALASDHRGYGAKEHLKQYLESLGHEVLDFGCSSPSSCDYPETAIPGAESVARGEAERAILWCGTGIGMCMSANKVVGVRAASVHDELTAEMSRRHNNANVLCLAADLLGQELMRRLVDVWLRTPYEAGRHDRRLRLLAEYEANHRCPPKSGNPAPAVAEVPDGA